MEGVLTLLQKEGYAGKRLLGQRGEEVEEGRMLGATRRNLWAEPSFASAQPSACVCVCV